MYLRGNIITLLQLISDTNIRCLSSLLSCCNKCFNLPSNALNMLTFSYKLLHRYKVIKLFHQSERIMFHSWYEKPLFNGVIQSEDEYQIMWIHLIFREISHDIQVRKLWMQDSQKHLQLPWIPWGLISIQTNILKMYNSLVVRFDNYTCNMQ